MLRSNRGAHQLAWEERQQRRASAQGGCENRDLHHDALLGAQGLQQSAPDCLVTLKIKQCQVGRERRYECVAAALCSRSARCLWAKLHETGGLSYTQALTGQRQLGQLCAIQAEGHDALRTWIRTQGLGPVGVGVEAPHQVGRVEGPRKRAISVRNESIDDLGCHAGARTCGVRMAPLVSSVSFAFPKPCDEATHYLHRQLSARLHLNSQQRP